MDRGERMREIKQIEIVCHEVDIDATTSNDLFRMPLTRVNMYKIDMEQLMENLNFEDVMNYYGVTQVCEWCEANR